MMQWFRGLSGVTAAVAVVMGSMVVTASSAAAEPDPPQNSPRGCAAKDNIGDGDELRPGRALCNANYLLRMQQNGDLVLREISTGRACWHSNTFVPGVSATFQSGSFRRDPKLKVGKGLLEIVGANDHGVIFHAGTTANLNAKGELYIGYEKHASC